MPFLSFLIQGLADRDLLPKYKMAWCWHQSRANTRMRLIAQRATAQFAAPMLRPVRPVGVTGQTGSPMQNGDIRQTLAREGPCQGKRA